MGQDISKRNQPWENGEDETEANYGIDSFSWKPKSHSTIVEWLFL